MKKQNKPRILLLDVETAPHNVYTWGLFKQNISLNQVIHPGYMLMWGAKWLGEDKVITDTIVNYPETFKKNPRSDKHIAVSAWKLLDEADIVIAHNGDAFDIKWLNTIFIKNNLPPVSSFKTIDTLQEAKASFRFMSNKLESLLKELSIGSKVENEGFGLWVKCMAGQKEAWKRMIHYCKGDVIGLEKLYLALRPFMKRHPNMSLYHEDETPRCTNCGGVHFRRKGYAYTQLNKFQRYECLGCGKNVRGAKTILTQTKRNNVLRNVL